MTIFAVEMNQHFLIADKLSCLMKNAETYIKSKGGYAKMSEFRSAGFHTREIKALVDDGKIEKVKAGLYKLSSAVDGGRINIGFIDVSKAFPQAVICLLSAAFYHQLSSINPSSIYAAIPRERKPPQIEYPPVKFYFWGKTAYEIGIIKVNTKSGVVKIYDKEKTVCDLFRYKKKLGEDVAIEALKNYLNFEDFNLNKLRTYAEKTRIKKSITPFIKAILG